MIKTPKEDEKPTKTPEEMANRGKRVFDGEDFSTDKGGEISITPIEVPEKYIVLYQAEDGNWKGWMRKYGKVHRERQGDPIHVVQNLLTLE